MAQPIDTKFVAPRGAFAAPGLGAILVGLLVLVVQAVLGWQARARERRHLATLDDRLLKDMGLSRADVNREVDKPFWRS